MPKAAAIRAAMRLRRRSIRKMPVIRLMPRVTAISPKVWMTTVVAIKPVPTRRVAIMSTCRCRIHRPPSLEDQAGMERLLDPCSFS
jgi:hypothetical protein